jgi:hypothetical protein
MSLGYVIASTVPPLFCSPSVARVVYIDRYLIYVEMHSLSSESEAMSSLCVDGLCQEWSVDWALVLKFLKTTRSVIYDSVANRIPTVITAKYQPVPVTRCAQDHVWKTEDHTPPE